MSTVSGFSGFEDKFFKDEVKVKNTKFKIMWTVSNPVKVVDSVDGLVTKNESEKIVTKENVIKWLETQYPKLTQQDGAYFYTDVTKEGTG